MAKVAYATLTLKFGIVIMSLGFYLFLTAKIKGCL